MVFAEFATEVGIPQSYFPDPTERKKIAEELSDRNEDLVANSNPAIRIVKSARDMIAGGVGHVVRSDGTEPTRDKASAFGWKKVENGGSTVRADSG